MRAGQFFFLFFEGLGRETSPEGVATPLLGGMAALFSLDDPQVARRASYPSTGLGLVDNFCRRPTVAVVPEPLPVYRHIKCVRYFAEVVRFG